jgi:hypothetical protein
MLLVLLLHCCQSLRHPVPKDLENGLHRVRVPVNRQRQGLEPGAAFLPACMLTVSYFLPTAPHKQHTARSMSSLQPRRLLQLKYQGYSSPVASALHSTICHFDMQLQNCRSCCSTAGYAGRGRIAPFGGRLQASGATKVQSRRHLVLVRAGEDMEPDVYCCVVCVDPHRSGMQFPH